MIENPIVGFEIPSQVSGSVPNPHQKAAPMSPVPKDQPARSVSSRPGPFLERYNKPANRRGTSGMSTGVYVAMPANAPKSAASKHLCKRGMGC